MGNFKNLDKLLDSFTQGTIPGCACVVMQNNELSMKAIQVTPILKREAKSMNFLFLDRRPQRSFLPMPSA